jgi:phage shock protein A
MTGPTTAREALIVEAIGDVAKLLREVEALDQTCQALNEASASLRDELSGFEGRMASITENAKVRTVKYLAARADEATRRSIDLQSRAMADAARIAFVAEFGATMQRLQATLQPLLQQRKRRWEGWLTHAAAAVTAAELTWFLALYLGPSGGR